MTATAPRMATAIYKDLWAGPLKASVQPFKTARSGQRVIRYRWITERGVMCGGWAPGGFKSVAEACRAARRHHGFSEVTEL
jgi:hypothetical protein